jgi:hypothetical protein
MAGGLPDTPPQPLEEFEEAEDEYCPSCGWDSTEATNNAQESYNAGTLLAIEKQDGSPFSTMGGAQLYAFYLKCPNQGLRADDEFVSEDRVEPERHFRRERCGHLFSVELEDLTGGAMS